MYACIVAWGRGQVKRTVAPAHFAWSAGKRPILGDLKILVITWVRKAAPEVNFEHQLLRFANESGIVQHFTQATRRTFGQVSSVVDLVLTRTPKNKWTREKEDPIDRSDHVVIRM